MAGRGVGNGTSLACTAIHGGGRASKEETECAGAAKSWYDQLRDAVGWVAARVRYMRLIIVPQFAGIAYIF
jgi:hypothetical protein